MKKILIIALIALSLAGCGGGGGVQQFKQPTSGQTDPIGNPPPPPPKPKPGH